MPKPMIKITSAGWPPENPYRKDFLEPINPRLVLEPEYRHGVLNTTQTLLEQACFYYAQRWMPHVLKQKKWKVPQDGELSEWWRAVQREKIPASSTAFPPDLNVEAPFVRLSQLRHAAVHRVETPVDILKRMMVDAIAIVGGIRDDLRCNRLQKMSEALQKDDMNALGTVITATLNEFPIFVFSRVPKEGSSLGTSVDDHQMTTLACLDRRLSNPPPQHRLSLPAKPIVSAPPPRRQSAPENLRPQSSRRSRSPTNVASKTYRVREKAVRTPSIRTANHRRSTGDFVDLTADSDNEATTAISKIAYTRRSAPANFIDLTIDD